MATTIFPRRRYWADTLVEISTSTWAVPIIRLEAQDILEYVECQGWLFNFEPGAVPPAQLAILETFLKFTFADIGGTPPSPDPAVPQASDTIKLSLLRYSSTEVETGSIATAFSELRSTDTLVWPSQSATLWLCMNNSFPLDHDMRPWSLSGWAYAEYRSLTEITPT